MRKTLIVSYLARGERSNTKKILDAFSACIKGSSVETLDLCKNPPDFFMPESLSVYYERNYGGQKIEPKREALMKKMDEMAAQFKSADIIVTAAPMNNFSFPAPLKAYFDSVMQKGVTWTIGAAGYEGMMKGKKALAITSSGGVYEGDSAAYDHYSGLIRAEFGLMGFDTVEVVSAAGLNMFPEKADDIVADACAKVKTIAEGWYA
jgi:FMN-dependent NADH-azoreductase